MRGDKRMSAEEWKLWEMAYDSDDDVVAMQKDAGLNLIGKGAATDVRHWSRLRPEPKSRQSTATHATHCHPALRQYDGWDSWDPLK